MISLGFLHPNPTLQIKTISQFNNLLSDQPQIPSSTAHYSPWIEDIPLDGSVECNKCNMILLCEFYYNQDCNHTLCFGTFNFFFIL